jgi:hypothetical protein
MSVRYLALCVLCLAAFTSVASAVNYYVRTTGLDTNAGTSPSAAFLTIQRALSAAQAGDTIYVGKGTYTGAISSVRSGTATAKIRLLGDRQGTYTGDKGTPQIRVSTSRTAGTTLNITHNNIEFERFTITYGLDTVSSSGTGIVFRTCTLGTSATAVRVTAGSLSLIGCTIRTTTDALVATGGTLTVNTSTITSATGNALSLSGAAAATIDRNTFRNLTGSMGSWSSTGTLTFTNNLVRSNPTGLSISAGTARLYNNTFFQPGTTALSLSGGTLALFNNIITQATNAVVVTGGSITHNNNLYYLNSTNYTGLSAATNDVYTDPRFVNTTSNWNIQSSSPCIDTGSNAASITTLDRNGATRPRGPAFDIGAYEVVGPSSNTPYFADFTSTSTPGTEWTSNASLTSTQSTRFAGPYTNNTLGLRVNTTPGADYTLIFDVYFMNTWDGDNLTHGVDYFNVSVDGDILLRSTYCFPGHGFPWSWPDHPESWRGTFSGAATTAGVFRSISLSFTAENAVSFINFFGEGLQAWPDEGWGIDNVRVVASSSAAQYTPAFIEFGRLNGFRQNMNTTGGALFAADLNADGLPDLIQGISSGASRTINRDGSNFSAATITGFSRQAALADFDNDGDIDLWASPLASATGEYEALFRNNGTGTLTAAIVSGLTAPSGNEGIAAADLNADGLCDVTFFSSNGNHAVLADPTAPSLTYTANTTSLPNSISDAGNGSFVASGDVNNDGFTDFFYLYNGGRLFLSNADGTYTSNSRGISISFSDSNKMGAAFADFDNDNDLDLFVANRNGGNTSLWLNPGPTGNFTNVATARGLAVASSITGCAWGDYDNDGDLDLFLTATSGMAMLFQNQGAPLYNFIEVTREGVSTEAVGGDALFTDINNDGNLDLALTSENASYPSLLYMNQEASSNFLEVRVIGKGLGGINRAGVGARVELWDITNTVFRQRRDIGSAKGFGGQEPLIAHFGGVSPSATYTLRIISGRRSYTALVSPGSASTTINATTIPQMYTFDENSQRGRLRVVRWREGSRVPSEDALRGIR